MKKFFGFGSTPPPPLSKAPLAGNPTPAQATEPSLVGRWKDADGSSDGSESTEFHADGTVTERITGGETIRGRYSMGGQKLTLNLEGVAAPLSFTVAIKDGTLEMTDPDGQKASYRRL